jgi:hypothetical protein
MNTTIQILDWFNNHKEDIWASVLSFVYGLEKAGGLRTVWSKILGPKPPQAEVETNKQDKQV